VEWKQNFLSANDSTGIRQGEIFDDGHEIDRLVVFVPVFGDLAFLNNAESKTLKELRAAPGLESHNLSEDLLLAMGPKEIKIHIRHDLCGGEFLRLGKDIEMEMRRATGRRRDLAP
jgi:hypothetical protein